MIGENSGVKFLGSISTSYITPNIYQLYSSYGNLELKPERLLNYEGGLSYYFNSLLEINIAYFKRDETNPINFETLYDADGNWAGGIYKNIASERMVKGLELDLSWTVNDKIKLGTNCTSITTDKKESYS